MSFSADTLMPLFSALPEDEQHAFAEKIQKLLKKKAAPRKKRKDDDIYAIVGEKCRPENREMWVTEIMNGQ